MRYTLKHHNCIIAIANSRATIYRKKKAIEKLNMSHAKTIQKELIITDIYKISRQDETKNEKIKNQVCFDDLEQPELKEPSPYDGDMQEEI